MLIERYTPNAGLKGGASASPAPQLVSPNAGLKGGASARPAPQSVSDAQATAYPPTISAVDFVAKPPLRPLGQSQPGRVPANIQMPSQSGMLGQPGQSMSIDQFERSGFMGPMTQEYRNPVDYQGSMRDPAAVRAYEAFTAGQMPPQSFGGMPPQDFGQMPQMQPFQPPPAQLERLQSLQQQFTNTDAFRNFDRMTPEQKQAAAMGGDPFANIPEFQAMNAAQQEIAQQQQQYNQQQQMMQQQAQQQMMQELMMLRQQQAERQQQSIQPAASPAAQPITPTQQRLRAQRLSSARQRRGIAGLLPPRPQR